MYISIRVFGSIETNSLACSVPVGGEGSWFSLKGGRGTPPGYGRCLFSTKVVFVC